MTTLPADLVVLSAQSASRPRQAAGKVRTLADLPIGVEALVANVRETGILGERLLEMGLTPGTPVTVVRRGIWADPVQINLRGYMLSLRRAQADMIDLEPAMP